MTSVIWPFEERVRIIKGFEPLEPPVFNDGNEDTFRFNVWGLYYRVCEAIKSYIVLYETNIIFDALIIAGHALETCAMLSYIKDNSREEAKREKYNSYFAGMIFNRIFANLEISQTLEDDISWMCYSHLLKMFYTVGKTIVSKNKDYEEVIKKINYRKGPNKEKMALFKKSFSPIKVSEYIETFSNNISNIDDGIFKFFYGKYCSFKHGNMLTPGASFEPEYKYEDDLKGYSLSLICILVYYLDTSKLNAFDINNIPSIKGFKPTSSSTRVGE